MFKLAYATSIPLYIWAILSFIFSSLVLYVVIYKTRNIKWKFVKLSGVFIGYSMSILATVVYFTDIREEAALKNLYILWGIFLVWLFIARVNAIGEKNE